MVAMEWKHPITLEPHRFTLSTVEGWFYKARKARHSPVLALGRKIRRDHGKFRQVSQPVREVIATLHRQHPGWSHQLHYDNLLVVAKREHLGPVGCYSTVCRYRNAHGMIKVRLPRNADRKGVLAAQEHRLAWEQLSYEVSHVHGLWHSDTHHCSRSLLTAQGEWAKPILIAFLDDRSRLVCHAQWYWRETTENFVHALYQAILKRGLPRSLMTDNGSPMTAGETTQGLGRLSILHQPTRPYSPEQNGKQENFWTQVEGRLMAMLEGEAELTLKLLNDATLAWVEREYHRKCHSETLQTPMDRYLAGPDVGRPTPSPQDLRLAFTVEITRMLRRSDTSISLEGQRFEVPAAFRHLKRICLRYATWDLSYVYMADQKTGNILGRIFPRDLEKNADGRRRALDVPSQQPARTDRSSGMAPLLSQYLADQQATGLPVGYLPKDERND